ncbi:hypothetical protein LguiB_016666 [Lonicera macranthoides]
MGFFHWGSNLLCIRKTSVLDLVGEGAKVLYVRKTDEYHSRTQGSREGIGGFDGTPIHHLGFLSSHVTSTYGGGWLKMMYVWWRLVKDDVTHKFKQINSLDG